MIKPALEVVSWLLKRAGLIFLCSGFLCSVAVGGSQDKLKGILHQINKVKIDLTKKEQQQTSVKQQLDSLKKRISILETSYKETTDKIKHQKIILAKLTKDYTNQQIKLKELNSTVAAQINLAYQTEHPNALMNLFGTKNTSVVNPDLILAYHRYIVIAHLEQMRNIKEILKHLEQNRQRIKRQTKELELTEIKQQQQKIELEKTKQSHNKILSSLKNNIAVQNQKLRQLLLDKKNLEKLIASLVLRKASNMSPAVRTKLCKNFVWPTNGLIVTHFGSAIEQSSWKWSGIMIRAAKNQDVHAMSSGKVVYADKLAGYGLLLIIDHENGYMSLYGHNSSLRKRLHTNVGAGEVVSTVGMSNSEEPELYFSIRYNGKPIDPERWCK